MKAKTVFGFAYMLPSYDVQIKLNEEESIHIYINTNNKYLLNTTNLYVWYCKNGTPKYFTGMVSDEVKDTLIELARKECDKIYKK